MDPTIQYSYFLLEQDVDISAKRQVSENSVRTHLYGDITLRVLAPRRDGTFARKKATPIGRIEVFPSLELMTGTSWGYPRWRYNEKHLRRVYTTLSRRVAMLENNGLHVVLFGVEIINNYLRVHGETGLPHIQTPYVTPVEGSVEYHARNADNGNRYFPFLWRGQNSRQQ